MIFVFCHSRGGGNPAFFCLLYFFTTFALQAELLSLDQHKKVTKETGPDNFLTVHSVDLR
jgi:hypothetical protein